MTFRKKNLLSKVNDASNCFPKVVADKIWIIGFKTDTCERILNGAFIVFFFMIIAGRWKNIYSGELGIFHKLSDKKKVPVVCSISFEKSFEGETFTPRKIFVPQSNSDIP